MLRREFRLSAEEVFCMPLWERELLIGEFNRELRAIEREQKKG